MKKKSEICGFFEHAADSLKQEPGEDRPISDNSNKVRKALCELQSANFFWINQYYHLPMCFN